MYRLFLVLCLLCARFLPCRADDSFRQFDENSPQSVKDFYAEHHAKQTVAFVLDKRAQYSNRTCSMTVWEAMELLDSIVDASDPDISLPQSYHAYQTAEAIRQAGLPRWMILTGFVHDLGKVLAAQGEPQWAVVGDTFPVGCAYSDQIVFGHYLNNNPDKQVPEYQTRFGIYKPECGFDNLLLSWGHDEYLYQVLKDQLPQEALYIIRFHSFYPAHTSGAYSYFMNAHDREMMPWLQLFQKYDLYTKNDAPLNIDALRPYYKELVEEFLPGAVFW